LFEQRFRLFEIGRVEALGEPAVDRRGTLGVDYDVVTSLAEVKF
jgi:hypothetical protein